MLDLLQVLFLLNIFFVLIVFLLLLRLQKAVSVFTWNPGDFDLQAKQKIIILKCIVSIAFVALLATMLNAFLA